ncbi:MAG: hypothetical protein J6Y36_09015 [Treponema sp.]|nr:hypothetical protein [Treponema sp.]
MKNTKVKILLISSILAAVSSISFALDTGFLLADNSEFKTDDNGSMYLDQKNNVYAWMKIPLEKNCINYFIAEGFYQFEYLSKTKTDLHYLDIDLFKFSFLYNLDNGYLKLNAGRYYSIDLTSIIYAQPADGFTLTYRNNNMSVSAFAAYTGLLNGNIVKMNNAPDFKGCDSNLVYDLQDRYLNAALSAAFYNIIDRQTLSVQAFGSIRFDSVSYNRFYTTLSLSGSLSKSVFYDASTTIGFTSYDGADMEVSPLVKAKIAYYFPQSSIGADFVFAGKNFCGITSIVALNSVNEPGYSNLMKLGMFATYKPVSNLVVKGQLGFAFDVLHDCEIKGIESSMSTEYQVASDVFCGLEISNYVDSNNTEFDCSKISLKCRIAL